MQCTVIDMSESLVEIWYILFAVVQYQPYSQTFARRDKFEPEICKNCNSGYKR